MQGKPESREARLAQLTAGSLRWQTGNSVPFCRKQWLCVGRALQLCPTAGRCASGMGRGPGVMGPGTEVKRPPGAAPAGSALPFTECFHPGPDPAANAEGAVAWVWFVCNALSGPFRLG